MLSCNALVAPQSIFSGECDINLPVLSAFIGEGDFEEGIRACFLSASTSLFDNAGTGFDS